MKTRVWIILGFSLAMLGCRDEPKPAKDPKVASQVEAETVSDNGFDVQVVEHASAVVNWDGTTLYIDPAGEAAAYSGFKDPDYILITDIHGDHMSPSTLGGLNLENTRIIAPQAVADELKDSFGDRIDILANGEDMDAAGIIVEAIPMYNLREEAKQFHEKGRGNGYVLTKGDMRVYFSGDTEDIPEMRSLKDIDKAFVCMNLPYTMTVEKAAEAVLAFKPEQVYPYHYRGRPDVSDVDRFKQIVNEGNPEIEVVQLDWYPNEDF